RIFEVKYLTDAQPKAPRKACFDVGDPIDLKTYLADYQRDRSGTIDRLSAELRQEMQARLDAMSTTTV
ncbi:MAG: 1-acyl-sn-glycerol-3-phosphate acyltransferase, partial [Cyanobacteria bacterium J06576_12]